MPLDSVYIIPIVEIENDCKDGLCVWYSHEFVLGMSTTVTEL